VPELNKYLARRTIANRILKSRASERCEKTLVTLVRHLYPVVRLFRYKMDRVGAPRSETLDSDVGAVNDTPDKSTRSVISASSRSFAENVEAANCSCSNAKHEARLEPFASNSISDRAISPSRLTRYQVELHNILPRCRPTRRCVRLRRN